MADRAAERETSRPHPHPLVGRRAELDLLEQLLGELERGPPAALALTGEPGIGKTRLLSELGGRAELRGHLVLAGSGSELERELPFSVFVHALDEYVESLDPTRLSTLDEGARAELSQVFPSLSALANRREPAIQHERYRSHRAVRALLERLAQTQPLVLVLDDFHWADSASLELLGALLRRPPAAPVLVAVAFRPQPLSERFAAALERARRTAALTLIELGALGFDEARTFLGDRVGAADLALLYEESGGNPFYLEQLARTSERAPGALSTPATLLADLGVPPAVAASLGEELALLSDGGRKLLEGAAVAGDPFELDLAAAAAGRSEKAASTAVDELLGLDLVRVTDAPRRFRFRHPLIRRAVYGATAAGWRLGAHERCARALAERGAPAAARAHHVERFAREGDMSAVSELRQAGETAARLAPESAARWFSAALRLLPQTATDDRLELLLARGRVLAAAGQFTASHEATLEAAAIAPNELSVRTTVATACGRAERLLGQYDRAHARLVRALRALPETASTESAELLTELTLNEFYRSRYPAMHDWAALAVAGARGVGDPVLIATALVMQAFASATTGPIDAARSHRAEAAEHVDELSDEELSRRPDTAGWLAIAEIYLDLYAEADAHASRAFELARTTAQGDPLHRLYPVLPRIWHVRGKLAQAAELLDGAIEASRLLGSPPALAGNLFNRSAVALAVGDLEVALSTAEEAVELTRDLDEGFVSAWAAVRFAAVLLETGNPGEAAELLVTRAGGEELALIPAGWKAFGLELLTRCWLGLDRDDRAGQAAELADATATAIPLPLARAWADRAKAAVALESGRTATAVELALASADAAHSAGAPIEEALSRLLAGRGLAQAGRSDEAVVELGHAAAGFDACGALRYRAAAERELGRLGRRPHRRTRAGANGETNLASLTERELQVARLVVDRKTNPEIAAELFLSQKTVETHLRNIFRKIDVGSRVELARAVERSDRATEPSAA
jgi:ATP/maltotriose-dependent transcriptional regulator MalT